MLLGKKHPMFEHIPMRPPLSCTLVACSAVAIGRQRSSEVPWGRREGQETMVGMSGKRKMIWFIISSPSAPFLCPSLYFLTYSCRGSVFLTVHINYTHFVDDSEHTNSFKLSIILYSFLAKCSKCHLQGLMFFHLQILQTLGAWLGFDFKMVQRCYSIVIIYLVITFA